jgi:tetratricopeptide (TPR) repeat protein
MIPAAGDIKDMTLPWLFQDLRTGKRTGTAIFSRDAELKKVFFKDGDILFASSNLKEDRLGEFLLRTGKISQTQFDKASEVVTKTGKKLGAVLFEEGALTSHELVSQVKLQVKEIILKLFMWRDGRFQFDGTPLPISEIIPLHISTGDLIIAGVRDIDWEIVRKSLSLLKTIIRPASDPSLLFQNAHLEQDQLEVFSLIDGSKSIEELCGMSGIGDFNTLKAIYILLALRMAEKGEIRVEAEKKFAQEVVRETVSSRELYAEQPAVAATVTKEMIQQAYEDRELKNHYEILGVDRNASVQEIKRAYFRCAKLYHPDRHFDPEMNDVKEKLDTLFSRIHDAYETLSSESERDNYNLSLAERKKKPGTHSGRGKRSNPEAALDQFSEGVKQFQAQNYWGAEESFQWAMRLEPGNVEYVFHLGLTLSRIPRRGREAEEFLLKAVEMAPSNVAYYLELGNFYMKNGLKAKALTVFQNALQYDPTSDKIKASINSAGDQS